MKKLSRICLIVAILLSNVMCATASYSYRDMLCGIEHEGFSAPAELAFLSVLPYAILIVVCLILAVVFHKKSK